jgi:glucose-6-phosphate isomerase
VVAPFELDCEIPGQHFTFGELLKAQANGDANVLAATGQPVLRIEATINGLCDALGVVEAS